ncbi:MAG TPA: DUF885 family protein, partial [Candidatus Omnitrophota bacterium]|nr:DUF885 family protein [Candidatus Omnitrophota bacterium]
MIRRSFVPSLAALLLLLAAPLSGARAEATHAAKPSKAARRGTPGAEQVRFEKLLEQSMRERFAANPSYATYMGVHDFDTRLENTSKAEIDAEAASMRRTITALEAIDKAKLDADARIDYDLFAGDLNGRLFRMTELRDWEKDPGTYGYGWAIGNLIARNFAPPKTRLRAVIARLRQVPRQLDNGRANVKNPPELLARFSAEDLEGLVAYLD